jgi:hypothetical protein
VRHAAQCAAAAGADLELVTANRDRRSSRDVDKVYDALHSRHA